MKYILIGALLTIGLFSCQQKPYVIIMGGQSNMVGAGKTADLASTDLPDQISYYNFAVKPGFKPARDDQFGPEVGLSQVLVKKYPDKEFILIKYAIGGASMLDWAVDYDSLKANITGKSARFGNMYQDLLTKTVGVLEGLKHQKIAFLWMQGERDARIPEAGVEYHANFTKFIEALRDDLESPDLPILFGKVNPPIDRYTAIETVQKAQKGIAKEMLNVFLIETDGLEKWKDDVHYSSKGQLELGRRYGEQLIAIMEKEADYPK